MEGYMLLHCALHSLVAAHIHAAGSGKSRPHKSIESCKADQRVANENTSRARSTTSVRKTVSRRDKSGLQEYGVSLN